LEDAIRQSKLAVDQLKCSPDELRVSFSERIISIGKRRASVGKLNVYVGELNEANRQSEPPIRQFSRAFGDRIRSIRKGAQSGDAARLPTVLGDECHDAIDFG
jgi:hypothetical protein